MGKALIYKQILLTNSCRKCMEISLESLYWILGLKGLSKCQHFHNCLQHFHSWGLSFEGNQSVSSRTQAQACSRRSDSGEWCEVKKEMKSRGGTLPLPRFYFFVLLFTSHCPPLPERLEQSTQALPYHFFVCACL